MVSVVGWRRRYSTSRKKGRWLCAGGHVQVREGLEKASLVLAEV